MQSVARQAARALTDPGPIRWSYMPHIGAHIRHPKEGRIMQDEAKRGNHAFSRPTQSNHIVSKQQYLGGYNENKAQMRKEVTKQYYFEHDIHDAAKQESHRLKATALFATGKLLDKSDSIRSAEYLRLELQTRVAHRIKGFHNLPFIITTNPYILDVMELYMRSFKIIKAFNNGEPIKTYDKVIDFSEVLERLMDDHGDVIEQLTKGFSQCYPHAVAHFYKGGKKTDTEPQRIKAIEQAEHEASEMVKAFLDRTFTSRLGIRMLAQHHLLLSDQQGRKSRDQIGIVQARWKPQKAIEAEAITVRDMWMERGVDNPPTVKFNGHTEATFPYIPMGIDHIFREVLKNAYRATIESYLYAPGSMPDIYVTIAVNKETFDVRISDRGKGIPDEIMTKICRYNFTTSGGRNSTSRAHGDLLTMGQGDDKELAGYGVGLPISKAYAEYLGGSLEIKTMKKIGTDVYLSFKHIDPMEGHSFQI
jgi:[3-methyl-2-oxobutanoate dehydrogenase (acetyl-transferring)] kinase